MGAAAIVGNQRISTSALASQVSNLQQTVRAGKGKIQLQFPQSQAPQQVLAWLVRMRVREQMAIRNHVTVTPRQSQQALAAIAAQARQNGNGVTLAMLAAANGLPPDLLGQLGRYQAIETVLLNRLDGGKLPTAQAALQRLGQQINHEQCVAAKSLHIKINPQFGRMDYGQFSIVPAAVTLSAPQVPSPAPTSSPLYTPPC
jgi:hypothetical protein